MATPLTYTALPQMWRKMKTFGQYFSEAGAGAERQETGLVDAINNSAKKGKIVLTTKGVNLSGVVKAEKYGGRSTAGTEPYTDVVITARKKYNVSMKGSSAPSLAGGGLAGMELVIPGIGKRFMEAALKHHKKTLKKGDKVPDLYAKLNDKDKMKLVLGDRKMGGPIDYMYIGPMDVVSKETRNGVSVNGKLEDAKKYAREHDLYFRLRARRGDQTFDPDAKDRGGIPTVYGKSPSRGDSKGRIMVTDKVPSARDIIVF